MMWRVYSASAIGKGHIDTGLPCQDAHAHFAQEDRLVAVVCDGAGSAKLSEIGAKMAAEFICDRLAGSFESDAWPEVIGAAFAEARASIESEAALNGQSANDYACTVVGCMIDRSQGWFFHLGDGQSIARRQDLPPILSSPENGEYNNETWFLTSASGLAHLRFTPIENPASIKVLSLMSDGASPFVMNRGATDFSAGFIDPVLNHLAQCSEEEGSTALSATLASERTWSITSDDKTLLIAVPTETNPPDDTNASL